MIGIMAWVLLSLSGLEKPVAMVLSCEKDSKVSREGETSGLSDGMLLFEKDEVVAGSAGVKVVLLVASRTVLVPARTKVTVGPKEFSPASAVKTVERKKGSPRLEKVSGLIRGGFAGVETYLPPMGPGTSGAISPLPGSQVVTSRPRLSWPAVKDATGYQVSLYKVLEVRLRGERVNCEPRQADDTGRKLFWTEKTEKNTYTPNARQSLPDGSRWTWDVVAFLKGGKKVTVVDNLDFTVMSKENQTKLAAAQPFKDSTEPEDWLLAAKTYELFKAADEALLLYEKLAGKRPGQANILQTLYLYYLRGRDQEKAEKMKKELKKLGIDLDASS